MPIGIAAVHVFEPTPTGACRQTVMDASARSQLSIADDNRDRSPAEIGEVSRPPPSDRRRSALRAQSG